MCVITTLLLISSHFFVNMDMASPDDKKGSGKKPIAPTDLVVRPFIDVKNDSKLYISWKSKASMKEWYALEIAQKNGNYLPIYNNLLCCNVTYSFHSRRRTVEFRIQAANGYGKSDYVESGLVLLPNYRWSSLELTIVYDAGHKLYLAWDESCEEHFLSYKLSYRKPTYPPKWMDVSIQTGTHHVAIDTIHDANYILQLIGFSKGKEMSSDFLYHLTKSLSRNVGKVIFSEITATQAAVHFAPPEHLATTPLNCELYLYEKTLKATPRKLPLISYNATISLTLNNLANYEMYFVKIKYWEMFNKTVVYSTESYLLVTKQGIPGKVSSASVARRNVSSSEYAVFWLVWNPPKTKNGIIKGYKIRWKLKRSKYNIFIQEQCQTSYVLKVYYIDEVYEVFISAKTTEGFGPEEKLEISVGTPSSHRNHTISGNESEDDDSDFNRFLNISREDFELQLRKAFGQQYRIGHSRILISVSTIMVCIMFAWFLKRVLLQSKGPNGNVCKTNESPKAIQGGTSVNNIPKVRTTGTKKRERSKALV